MNILVVSQYYYPEPLRINEICEELVKRGHKVTVLTANPNYPDGEMYEGYKNKDAIEEINGVTVIRCKCRPRHKGFINLALNYCDFVIKANRKIDRIKGKFDCVYVYQLSPITSCIPAIKYKKKNQLPMFLYCLDLWPESLKHTPLEKGLGFKILEYISKSIYSEAEQIAVTSSAFIGYLNDKLRLESTQIEYLPQHSYEIGLDIINNSVDNEYSDKINFVFMGNIGEAQNLECLLNAISKINDRSEFMFHIVGSGSYYDKCVKLSTKLKVDDTVVFYGRHPKSDMPKFYSMADVCYVSLRDEGIVGNTIPGKVQEYMSAGKPILACMNGDTSEIIKQANCGICVPAEDESELAKAIVKMVRLKDDFKNMGECSKEYFNNYFTISIHVDRLEKLLGELTR